MAFLVGFARFYAGAAHLPLDVLGGAAMGWPVGCLVHILLGEFGWLHNSLRSCQTVEMGRRTIHDLIEDARSHLARVEPEEAQAAMSEGSVLIDTRSSDDVRRAGSIPGALHIPLSVLEWRVDAASESHDPAVGDGRIMLLCAHGFSSSLAARRLQELGFDDATDVIGGFEAWAAAGLPINPPEP